MGFISYSLKYYYDALKNFETDTVTLKSIYKAKQLLKMIDDLADEGYTELNKKIEESYRGVSRIREYLRRNNAEPFKLCEKTVRESDVVYGEEAFELKQAINVALQKAEKTENNSKAPFLQRLIDFCNWIGYKEDTAYIFLLRDALLPYVYYKSKNRNGIYPWLLGRKTLEFLLGKEGVDDELRASIIKALEFGQCKSFNEFCDVVLPDIRKTLCKYPEIRSYLTELLKEIGEEQVIVVESGCCGTFPMLLMSLDNRIDMRMYTTYPYLSEIYAERVFTSKYEENRLFETLYSQDLYFRFSGLDSRDFHVNKCMDKEVEEKAICEIKAMREASLIVS